MSIDGLFRIRDLSIEDGTVKAVLSLDPDHPVYQGHFPGNPVTPGVCQIQIIKEMVSQVIEKPCALINAKNIKFLKILQPQEQQIILTLDYLQENDDIKVKATLSAQETIFIKFSGTFQVSPLSR